MHEALGFSRILRRAHCFHCGTRIADVTSEVGSLEPESLIHSAEVKMLENVRARNCVNLYMLLASNKIASTGPRGAVAIFGCLCIAHLAERRADISLSICPGNIRGRRAIVHWRR